jgi:hypothetical protein
VETWVDRVNVRAAVLVDQICAARTVSETVSAEIGQGMADLYRRKLAELYREELPLAILLDSSDLVLHAEGPAARDSKPSLHAVNWIIGQTEKHLRALARSLFDLAEQDAKRLGQALDLRLTGFAPGSIYTGVCLAPPPASLYGEGDQEPIFRTIRDAIRGLPTIPTFVEDEAIAPGIYEAFPDPAKRDANLSAAYNLAPTGKLGIHTMEIFVPGAAPAELSQRERVVIRDALKRPKLHQARPGTFIGEIREIDLDKTRFHLRGTEVGSLRCVLPEITAHTAKPLLGEMVRVEGDYESDPSGRPRLLLVSSITVVKKPAQEPLSLD